jgi:adenine-specific DNA-methyltransferase
MPELIWEGKYDSTGARTAPLRVALPFQTVETVNESAQDRQRSLDLFGGGEPSDWRNRLIWGDKKYVLPALLSEFAGAVDLAYVDPPFATGQDFSFSVRLEDADFVKEPSVIELKAYRDTWGQGLDSYLAWFYDMVSALHSLLSPTGALYVHIDPGVSHLVKLVLDEVFGPDGFRNEIIWKRSSAHNSAKRWGPVHDVIFFYTRGTSYTWNEVFQELPAETAAQWYNNVETGTDRRYNRADLTAPGTRTGSSGAPWRGINPTAKGRHWAIPRFVGDLVKGLDTIEALDALDQAGRLHWPKDPSGTPMLKRYLDESRGIAAQDVISDIYVNNIAAERVGYPTQKPEALLERIIAASTDPGNLVLDCVCGSGTTAVAAEKLARRWIAADLGRFAIHTARKRLLGLPGVKPFVVQNLGKYERQQWHSAEFGASAEARTSAYRSFILNLYHATPVSGYLWLHGLKAGRMVHVGTVDAPVTVGDVKQIATEFRKTVGTGENAPKTQSVDVLGWDFAFEVNEVARQDATRAGIELRLVRIPREVLEKRAVEQGDIHFFELAALSVGVEQTGRQVTLSLDDFIIPLDDVPAEVQQAVKHWSQWIDYWAVDWDNKGDAFHNEWQTYRARKSKALDLSTRNTYEASGDYSVVVKVIDILGNDTTKTLRITVP